MEAAVVLVGSGDVFFCKQKTAYEMRISDWSSDVCSSDLASRLGSEGREAVQCAIQESCDAFFGDRPGVGIRVGDGELGRLRHAVPRHAELGERHLRPQLRGQLIEPRGRVAAPERAARPCHGVGRRRCIVGDGMWQDRRMRLRSEEHTSELQSLMRISYAVFCLKKKKKERTI